MTKQPNTHSTETDLPDRLAERLLTAWQEANGTPTSRVSIFPGEAGFIILIDEAFTQAERMLAKDGNARNTLRLYVRDLMRVIADQELALLGPALGQDTHSCRTDANFDNRWVMWYFRLNNPQSQAQYSQTTDRITRTGTEESAAS